MKDRRWFKVETGEIFSVEFQRLSERQCILLQSLRHLAAVSENEDAGKLTGLVGTVEDVAKVARRQRRTILADLQQMGHFVSLDGDRVYLKGWADLQGPPMARRREQWRRSQAGHRGDVNVDSTLSQQRVNALEVEEKKKEYMSSAAAGVGGPQCAAEDGGPLDELLVLLRQDDERFTAFDCSLLTQAPTEQECSAVRARIATAYEVYDSRICTRKGHVPCRNPAGLLAGLLRGCMERAHGLSPTEWAQAEATLVKQDAK